MASVAGIQIEKNANGTLKSITFDAQKYGKILRPILEDLGLLEDARLQKQFLTLDDAKAKTKKRLIELCKKDGIL